MDCFLVPFHRPRHAIMPEDTSKKRSLFMPYLALALVLIAGASVASLHGASLHATSLQGAQTQGLQAAGPDSVFTVAVGFNSQIRLGHWSPIALQFVDPAVAQVVERVEVTCPDGDDLPITYSQAPWRSENSPEILQAMCRVGRTRGMISITAFSADGTRLGTSTQELSGQPEGEVYAAPSTARLVLYVTEADQELSRSKASLNRQSLYPDIVVNSIPMEQLPVDWNGYRSVDTVVLGATSLSYLERLGTQRLRALNDWVHQGGSLVFWVADDALASLQPGGILEKFGPFETVQSHQLKSTSRLESFINSPIPLLKLSDETLDAVSVTGTRISPIVVQDNVTVISRYVSGFGLVTFVGLELNQEPLLSWPASPALLDSLLNPGQTSNERSGDSATVEASRNGYLDLAGQLRVPLEQFRSVGFIPFTAIAVLIVVFLLMVGPGDYWLLRSMGRRMHWTWFTFPLVVCGFSGVAYWLNHIAKPSERQSNQFEIVDIDLETQTIRGHIWSSVYSPDSSTIDLNLEVVRPEVSRLLHHELSWMGQPGGGLGGMQNTTPVLTLADGYRSEQRDGEMPMAIDLQGFPTAVASVRTLAGRWSGSINMAVRSRLRIIQRVDRIDGDFSNPFDFPLIRPRILFRGSVYFIERDLAPGDTMDLFSEAKELTAKTYITRRARGAKEESQSMPWNQSETDMSKIGEMIMFHKLSGGTAYTGLSNRYLENVELTDLLLPNQAILVAEVPVSFTRLNVNGEALPTEVLDKKTTLIRILLPVELINDSK